MVRAACGHELPDWAKFCLECGTPVAPRLRALAEARLLDEKKGHTVRVARVEELRTEVVASLRG